MGLGALAGSFECISAGAVGKTELMCAGGHCSAHLG